MDGRKLSCHRPTKRLRVVEASEDDSVPAGPQDLGNAHEHLEAAVPNESSFSSDCPEQRIDRCGDDDTQGSKSFTDCDNSISSRDSDVRHVLGCLHSSADSSDVPEASIVIDKDCNNSEPSSDCDVECVLGFLHLSANHEEVSEASTDYSVHVDCDNSVLCNDSAVGKDVSDVRHYCQDISDTSDTSEALCQLNCEPNFSIVEKCEELLPVALETSQDRQDINLSCQMHMSKDNISHDAILTVNKDLFPIEDAEGLFQRNHDDMKSAGNGGISMEESSVVGIPNVSWNHASTPIKGSACHPLLDDSISPIKKDFLCGSLAPALLSDSNSSAESESDTEVALELSISDTEVDGSQSSYPAISDVDCESDDESCNSDNECALDISRSGQEDDTPLARARDLNKLKVHEFSDLSVNEGILHIMDLHLKNKQPKQGLHRAVKTIHKLLPKTNNLPKNSDSILSYIESLAAPVNASVHFFCQVCLYYKGIDSNGQCEVCQEYTRFSCFYSFEVKSLIRYLFEYRQLASILDNTTSNSLDPTVFKDLRDGSVYRALNENRNKYDINLMLNTDGVRIRKGSPKELWVLLCTIVDIPLHLQKSYIMVLGIWYDNKKPDMKTFLKPYAVEMSVLHDNGVDWRHPVTKEVNSSKVRQPVVVSDAPARSMIQNAMHFNCKYGCPLCEIKSKRTQPVPGKKRIRVYYHKNNVTLRSKERILRQAAEVGEEPHKKGIKGPSPLSIIPSVDISQCLVPEYMHSCLLGVMKQLLTIWTQKPGPWSVKDRMSEIDVALAACKHPDFIHRSQRQLKSLKYWKASDFYYFLLFESLPCLNGILQDQYLQHFILLVKGLFILLKTSINDVEISEAEVLLTLFVVDFETLYGDRQLTYNVHQLTHMALCVRRFGPLFSHSAFSFEDMNGIIAKSTHGTNYVGVEILRNIKICHGLQVLRNIVQNLNECVLTDHCDLKGELLGKQLEDAELCQEELNLFPHESPQIFRRARLGLDVFSSKKYKKLNSVNYHVSFTHEGVEKFGLIQHYAKTAGDTFVVIQLFTVDHLQVFHNIQTRKCIDHIVPVHFSDKYVAIRVDDIIRSAVKVGKIKNFIFKRPNLYRYVL